MKIHPAIGIARVGDSATGFTVGPEAAGALPEELDGTPVTAFRDPEGALRRQAARFRIFDGDAEVVIGSTVGGKTVTDIVWSCRLANKKAIFYAFEQLEGESGYAPDAPLRNPQITDPVARQALIIDPGSATVSQSAPTASFARDPQSAYPQTFPPADLDPVSIDTLGDLKLDSEGRLLVLGGHGHSGSMLDIDLDLSANYANNPGWFDDVSDGPVSATVHFSDGTTSETDGAWCIVAPPAYAPEIMNQVTLFDVLFDLFVRTTPGFRPDIYANGAFVDTYAPSFPDEVLPILLRAGLMSWVATREQGESRGELVNTYTSKVLQAPHDFGALGSGASLAASFARDVLRTDVNDPFLPQSVTPAMPFVAGDNPISNDTVSKFLTLTETQRFMVSQWAAGKATDAPAAALSPGESIDRGVLENCVGGPFCPGIEAGWITRNPALYRAPFRVAIKPLPPVGLTMNAVVGPSEPGDLTSRMAQPWQSDFNQCSVQSISTRDPALNKAPDGTTVPTPNFLTLWWPAQRPMAIYTRPGRQSPANWARDTSGNDFTNRDMADNWAKLGFVLNQGTAEAPDFVEVQRATTPFGRPAEAVLEVDDSGAKALLQRLHGADPGEAAHVASALAAVAAGNPSAIQSAAVDFFTEGAQPTRDQRSQCRKVADQLESRYAADADDIHQPSTVSELVDLVTSALGNGQTVKAVGSARSLSDAPEPADNAVLVSTCGFSTAYDVGASTLKAPVSAAMLYRCGAGRTVEEILGELDPNPHDPTAPMPRTFENLGAGQFQTLMGAIGTSTHGSGLTKPSFPQMVLALELVRVTADGDVVAERLEPTDGITDPAKWGPSQTHDGVPVTLVQDDDAFNAVLVSMGTTGVVYAVTVQLVPGFYLQEERAVTTWQAVKPQLDQLLADNEYFELVLDPLTSVDDDGNTVNLCLTSKRNTVSTYTDCGKRPALMEVGTTELGRISSAVLLEWALKNPPKRVPFNLSTGVKGSAVSCYTDKSYHVLQLNMDVNAASTEQNVPVEDAVTAIDDVLQYMQKNFDAFSTRFPPGKGSDFDRDTPYNEDPQALMDAWQEVPISTSPLGIRFVPGNDAMLSQMYKRATCTIEFPMPGSDYLDAQAAKAKQDPSKLVQLYTAYLAGRRKLFQDVEALLQAKVGARPHWGQANYVDGKEAAALFPAFHEWFAQYQAYNPKGTFNGAITNRLGISVYPHADRVELPDGPVTGEATFRHDRSTNFGILKIKEDLGWTLYNGLTDPVDTTCQWLFPKKCKRMGVSFVGSTQNLADPVVIEMRFSETGELVSRVDDFQLYHSFAQNRQYGVATFDGDRITITGDAAAGLREFVNAGRRVSGEQGIAPDSPVVLKLIDVETGVWTVESL